MSYSQTLRPVIRKCVDLFMLCLFMLCLFMLCLFKDDMYSTISKM